MAITLGLKVHMDLASCLILVLHLLHVLDVDLTAHLRSGLQML